MSDDMSYINNKGFCSLVPTCNTKMRITVNLATFINETPNFMLDTSLNHLSKKVSSSIAALNLLHV